MKLKRKVKVTGALIKKKDWFLRLNPKGLSSALLRSYASSTETEQKGYDLADDDYNPFPIDIQSNALRGRDDKPCVKGVDENNTGGASDSTESGSSNDYDFTDNCHSHLPLSFVLVVDSDFLFYYCIQKAIEFREFVTSVALRTYSSYFYLL